VRNHLLRALPHADLQRMAHRLRPIDLLFNTTLLACGASVDALQFIEHGTVSMITLFEDGDRIEAGIVGAEGIVGLPLLFGTHTSPLEARVQVEGSALQLSAEGLRSSLLEIPALLPLLLRYVDTFLFQVAQSAACNGRHDIGQRLARWLLMEHDRADGDSFPLTHEFLSIMLGVRRSGVTTAIGVLKQSGILAYTRRGVHVLDRPALEVAACECYSLVQRRARQVMGPHPA
jgi:CRP-like cAMP-binding protein